MRVNFKVLIVVGLLLLASLAFALKIWLLPSLSVEKLTVQLPTVEERQANESDLARESIFSPLPRDRPDKPAISTQSEKPKKDTKPEPIEEAPLYPTEIYGGNTAVTRLIKSELMQSSQKKQVKTSFEKIDFQGRVLSEPAVRWSCARDTKTGLLWETKLFDAGVSDVEHRYTWFDPTRQTPGHQAKGHCFGIDCDTHAYTIEMNRLGLCGSKRWRLPTFVELETLLDRDFFNPVINQPIFYQTTAASYWTQTQLDNNPEMAMQIDFFNGTSSPAPTHFALAVRVVSK